MATSRILATGTISKGGEVDWRIAPLPQDEPQDGDLQRFIDASYAPPPRTRDERADEAAWQADTAAYFEWAKREAMDLEDDMLEREWLRLGC
jgi:hypothetical protein